MVGIWFWWILIIVVVAALIRFALASANRRPRPDAESPEMVLNRRYADGEIDKKTYDWMLDDLKQ
jgi:uncharacterized membrane protein